MEHVADQIATALEEKGWCVIDAALPASVASALARECGESAAVTFKQAGTGRHQDHHNDQGVRSDAIRWFDPSSSADAAYLRSMDDLREALNHRLFRGLLDYECHYARYAPGAFYRKHLDAFAGAKNRVLSTVLYLNEDWREEEGGELLLYAAGEELAFEAILPEYNRLVVFLSERFPHEVKPATRARHSIAGWFRVRS